MEKKLKKIVENNDKIKNYGILFCLAFTDFLLIGFYVLISIITVSKINMLSTIMLLLSLTSSILFIVLYQLENNKEVEIKAKKCNKKFSKEKAKKTSKMYQVNKNQNKKQFRSKLKET